MQLINCLWFGHVQRDFLVIHRWFPVFLDFQTKPQKTSWRHNQPKLGTCPKKAIWKTCKIWEWNPGWVNRKGEWLAKWNNVSQHGHFFSRPQTTDSFTLVLQAKSSRVCVTETSYLGLSWPHQFWRFAPGRVALQGYFRDRHRALRARPLKGSGRPQLSPAPQALGAEGNAAQMWSYPIAECKNMIKYVEVSKKNFMLWLLTHLGRDF